MAAVLTCGYHNWSFTDITGGFVAKSALAPSDLHPREWGQTTWNLCRNDFWVVTGLNTHPRFQNGGEGRGESGGLQQRCGHGFSATAALPFQQPARGDKSTCTGEVQGTRLISQHFKTPPTSTIAIVAVSSNGQIVNVSSSMMYFEQRQDVRR